MRTTDLSVQSREDLGKRSTKALRREGGVPGVIYRNGKAEHISVNGKEVHKVLFTPHTYIINLQQEGGEAVSAIVRDAEYHPVHEHPLHVEFMEVTADREVTLQLPVNLTGTPKGVMQGGKLVTKLRRIKVHGIPKDLPESVEIDVSDLDLGGTIKIQDANIEGLNIVTPHSAAVASVEIPRALRSAQSASGDDGAEAVAE